ncbi:phospholipid carrier-dependent glycosyltransferase [soil metagenome]
MDKTQSSGESPSSSVPSKPSEKRVPVADRASAPGPTALDAWWGRTLRTPARLRVWSTIAPLFVVGLAAFVRVYNLGWPDSLVFDETYYVKDALSMSRLGYEAAWPDGANTAINAGQTEGFLSEAEFAVHPPLGKWIISLGFGIWGRGNPFGWRAAVALCGILVVLLVYLIAKHLFHSIVLASIAGTLIAIDGQAIVMSRTAILDGPLTLLCLAGVGAVLIDRWWLGRHDRLRMPGRTVLWKRPWLVVAGLLFGLACATKWSGVWFLLAFALYVVILDILERRRQRPSRAIGRESTGREIPGEAIAGEAIAGETIAGETITVAEPSPTPGLAAPAVLQALITSATLAFTAAVAYLATWTGWFLSPGASDRSWAEQHGALWTGVFAWVPPIIQNFIHHHLAMLAFNVNLSTPHGYQANPLTWLLYTQPLSMYTRTTSGGIGPCGETVCRETAWLMVNPIIWWASVAAVVVILVRFVLRRERRLGVILLGVAAGYLPWLLFINRTIFQFYSIIFEPYLILALTAVLGYLLGRRSDPRRVRVFGITVVAGFLLVCVAVSAFFYPLWVASPPVTNGFIDWHLWLVSWRWE